MCLSVLSALDYLGARGLQKLGVDYTWALALDSVCLVLLGFMLGRANTRLTIVGLAIVIISFALRLNESLDHEDHSMFWFEPYLRSGVYALAFALAYVAAIFRRTPEIS